MTASYGEDSPMTSPSEPPATVEGTRNLVVCCDGTGNQPGARKDTNVVRLVDMLAKDDGQIVYYDGGVGTLGAQGAWTRAGQLFTKGLGLAFGYGLRQNIAEAYQFLMSTYRPGDRIFLFGFSRGAYTVRALAGLLWMCGLPMAGNGPLTPYSIRLYTTDKELKSLDWETRDLFRETFSRPEFPPHGSESEVPPHVHFMGIWDTVKFVGWFNIRGRFKESRWPYTRNLRGVGHIRHAVSIDERRRFYRAYLISEDQRTRFGRDIEEVWFAGVHSDVGGGFEEHQLADLSLKWITDEAMKQQLRVVQDRYDAHCNTGTDDYLGPLHRMPRIWGILGYRNRVIRDGERFPPSTPQSAHVHRSVKQRMEASSVAEHPYVPPLPPEVTWVE